MRVAALDCGTNSIRLLVTDIAAGRQTDLQREMRVVRLGQGVDRTGRLAPEALARTREALQEYARLCTSHGVERTRMVATSATRDALNRSAFEAMVQEVLGVAPEIISGDEEASLSFDGATRGLDRAHGPFLVVDIGGGSTELVAGGATVAAAISLDVGCVRLTERHLHSDPPTADEVERTIIDVEDALRGRLAGLSVGTARTSVWLAGSATTVAAHALRLTSYDAERTHLARLTADQVREACYDLLQMTRAQRSALPYMHPGRVDVIGAGALIMAVLVGMTGQRQLVVSESDILDGIAWSVPRQGEP